jgi:hypothetical protein
MATLSAAAAVFPNLSFENLLWDVPESFLYQAENIYAARLGLQLTRVKSDISNEFVENWQKVTGRVWNGED